MGLNKHDYFGIYWAIAIVMLPLFLKMGAPVDPNLAKDQWFLFITGISIIIWGYFKEPFRHYKHIIISLIGLLIIGFFNREKFEDFLYLYQSMMFFSGCALFVQMLCNLSDKNSKYIVKGMQITCLIQTVLVFISLLRVDGYHELLGLFYNFQTLWPGGGLNESIHTGLGSLGNPNQAGALIAVTASSLLAYPNLFAFAVLGCAVTSAMPILSLGFACLITYWIKKGMPYKKAFIILISLLIFTMIGLSYDRSSFFYASGRFEAWGNAIYMIKGWSNIWGGGLGYFADNYNVLFAPKYHFLQAHNEYIELYIAFGLLGVLLVFFLIIRQIKQVIKGDKVFLVSALAILANSFANFPFHISCIATIGLISMAMLLKESPDGKCMDK